MNQELTPHSVWGIYWPGAALFLRHPPHFYSAVYTRWVNSPKYGLPPLKKYPLAGGKQGIRVADVQERMRKIDSINAARSAKKTAIEQLSGTALPTSDFSQTGWKCEYCDEYYGPGARPVQCIGSCESNSFVPA